MPSHAIILCIIYPVLGLMLARAVHGYSVLPLLFPLAAGFALLGPFAALGLYELSRRRENGERAPSALAALDVLRSPSFGAMLGLGVLLLALFVWPWFNQRGVELKERYERRSDLSRVTAGQFQSSSDGRRVFFIERDSADARVGRNVFVLTLQGDNEAVTSARAGRVEFEGGERFIQLERGLRNEQDLKSGEKTNEPRGNGA